MKEKIIVEIEARHIKKIDAVCEQIHALLRFTVDSNLIESAKIIRDHKKEISIFPMPKPLSNKRLKERFPSSYGNVRDLPKFT